LRNVRRESGTTCIRGWNDDAKNGMMRLLVYAVISFDCDQTMVCQLSEVALVTVCYQEPVWVAAVAVEL
jgi:hypothetical protein